MNPANTSSMGLMAHDIQTGPGAGYIIPINNPTQELLEIPGTVIVDRQSTRNSDCEHAF
jgi:hypothetical protein